LIWQLHLRHRRTLSWRNALKETRVNSFRKDNLGLLMPLGGQPHNGIGEHKGVGGHAGRIRDFQIKDSGPDAIFQMRLLTCVWVFKHSCEILISCEIIIWPIEYA
jgi:hypothetical protein